MAYKESLLQWIWQELQFSCKNLSTFCGKKIEIRDNGTINRGAGPDFLGVHLYIDGLDWHGSVEIHNTAKEWFLHSHQLDKNFNNVVLHVVGSELGLSTVYTENGSKPFTLCLQPYLQKRLYQLLQNSKQESIPCAANVEFINQKAFEKQVEIAHKEYFDFKVNELIQFYPAGVPLIRAWKQALSQQIFRTLGISANREQMSELGTRVCSVNCLSNDLSEWQAKVHQTAFNTEETHKSIQWVATGIRPSGKPKYRVRQAATFQYAIAGLSPSVLLHGAHYAWKETVEVIPSSDMPGAMMSRLVYYTAFVPALYLLGKLLHDTSLMNNCYTCWLNQSAFLPEKIHKPFKEAGFNVNSGLKKLGLAHQYKRYCSQKDCSNCKVFKNAIRA